MSQSRNVLVCVDGDLGAELNHVANPQSPDKIIQRDSFDFFIVLQVLMVVRWIHINKYDERHDAEQEVDVEPREVDSGVVEEVLDELLNVRLLSWEESASKLSVDDEHCS